MRLIVGFALTTGLFAQTTEEPPLITVNGTAEVAVRPDLAQVTFGVETRDKDLALAKSRNSAAVASVMSAIKKFAIDPKDVQTSILQIAPSYDDEKDGQRLRYFSVNTGVNVTLRNLKQTADFLSEVLNAGANRVQRLQFGSSEPRKYADQARLLALQAAKEKALAIAKELGVQMGKPYRVVEGGDWGGNLTANNYVTVEQMWLRTGDIEPGQIKISATFTVSFEMK